MAVLHGQVGLAAGCGKAADAKAVNRRSASVGPAPPLGPATPRPAADHVDGTQLAVSDSALDAIFAGDSADAVWKGSDQSLLADSASGAERADRVERPNLSTPRTIMVTASTHRHS